MRWHADATAAEAARKPSIAAGVLGSQVIIETGTPDALPLGDWVADLFVVADATDANLKTLAAAEAGRVLSPYRGVAVVGNPAGAKAGLSKAALLEWAKGTGGTGTIAEDASGLWVVVKMPPLKGGDDWSHYWHGPDGNPVSEDTAFSGKRYQMQWHGYPVQGARSYNVQVSAGRFFTTTLQEYASMVSHQHPEMPPTLEARNLYNGKLLWRRALSSQFGDLGSLMVATPDRLYLKDVADVLVLNPETGAELQRIPVATTPNQVRWLILSDGVLVTLAGPPPFNGVVGLPRLKGESVDDYNKRSLQSFHEQEACREAAGWDPATGKRLWQYKAAQIYPRKLAASSSRLFLYVDDKEALGLDLKTGKELWRQPSPTASQMLSKYDPGENRGEMLAIATPQAYLICDGFRKQIQAFAAENGRPLWGNDKFKGAAYALVLGDTIFSRAMLPTDLLTGGTNTHSPFAKTFHWNADSCGHTTAVKSGLWLADGGGLVDLASGMQCGPSKMTKSACGTGFFVADGVEVMYPNVCECSYQWGGIFVTRPVPDRPLREGARLEKGDAPAIPKTEADARDWTTQRSDETRKGSSPAVVPATAGIRWTYTPPQPVSGCAPVLPLHLKSDPDPSQPIAVGTRVYFGSSEGAVVCIDSASGKEIWRYWTAGAVKAAPTWAAGRLFAGSSDGWVYCLDAATGKLCWRYRMAREERRLSLMDGLGSPWPVLASVLVHDGVAYAAAGLRGQLDGSTLCALDACTGAEKWRKDFEPNVKMDAKGEVVAYESPSGGGALAWYGGKLWWHAGQWGGPAVVDPATGAMRRAFNYPSTMNYGLIMSEDMGVLPGGWVVFGGLRITKGPAYWAAGGFSSPALFLRTGPEGLPDNPDPLKAPPHIMKTTNTNGSSHLSRRLPSWDESEALLPGDFDATNKAPILCKDFSSWLNAEDDAHPWNEETIKKAQASWEKTISNGKLQRVAGLAALSADHQRPVLPDDLAAGLQAKTFQLSGLMTLARNAVVLTAARDSSNLAVGANNWFVFALNRADHSKLWEVPLPAQPAQTGMSITRDGDVLVPLFDGRVVCIGAGAPQTPLPEPATNVANASPGLEASDYACDWEDNGYRSNWSPADFAVLKPVTTRVLTEGNYDEGKKTGQTLMRLRGFIEVPKTGLYRFSIKTPSGGCLYFNLYDRTGQLVLRRGVKAWGACSLGEILLEQGKHLIDLATSSGDNGRKFALRWDGPDFKDAEVPASSLFHVPEPNK